MLREVKHRPRTPAEAAGTRGSKCIPVALPSWCRNVRVMGGCACTPARDKRAEQQQPPSKASEDEFHDTQTFSPQVGSLRRKVTMDELRLEIADVVDGSRCVLFDIHLKAMLFRLSRVAEQNRGAGCDCR